jgi:hypothetical protein
MYIMWCERDARDVCVWNIWRDVKLLAVFDVSFFLILHYVFHIYFQQEATGVPGGSVANEDTPPGTRVNVPAF